MKIALVVPGGVDSSGRERVVPALLWLIERLARRHDLHVFAVDYLPAPRSYDLLGAKVHDLGRVTGPIGFRRVRIARRLIDALRRHGPFDVLHAYLGIPAGIATVHASRRLRVPAVVTLIGGELSAIDDIAYGSQRRWLDRRAIRAILRSATAINVPTDYMARRPVLAGTRPVIIPTGVDSSRFVPAAHAPEGPPWRLVRVASINRVKDYPTLLHALARIAGGHSAFRDIHLDIAGEDLLGGAMQSLAARLGVADRVTFHGFQPTDRLPPFYARAHLNVVSSRHEAANVAMVEAACMELPTVGSAVGHVADWHPDAAVAVAPGDPTALADAIVSLLADRDRRRAIGRGARTWALAHDADATTAAFERLYARIVTPPPRPAP